MKINNCGGDLTDISAKKEALVATVSDSRLQCSNDALIDKMNALVLCVENGRILYSLLGMSELRQTVHAFTAIVVLLPGWLLVTDGTRWILAALGNLRECLPCRY